MAVQKLRLVAAAARVAAAAAVELDAEGAAAAPAESAASVAEQAAMAAALVAAAPLAEEVEVVVAAAANGAWSPRERPTNAELVLRSLGRAKAAWRGGSWASLLLESGSPTPSSPNRHLGFSAPRHERRQARTGGRRRCALQ